MIVRIINGTYIDNVTSITPLTEDTLTLHTSNGESHPIYTLDIEMIE